MASWLHYSQTLIICLVMILSSLNMRLNIVPIHKVLQSSIVTIMGVRCGQLYHIYYFFQLRYQDLSIAFQDWSMCTIFFQQYSTNGLFLIIHLAHGDVLLTMNGNGSMMNQQTLFMNIHQCPSPCITPCEYHPFMLLSQYHHHKLARNLGLIPPSPTWRILSSILAASILKMLIPIYIFVHLHKLPFGISMPNGVVQACGYL